MAGAGKRQPSILHIDFDSFFASCEQQANPLFRNRPLGVTATNGRNCIIASSREAKKLGIKTGARVSEAKQLCPDLLLTPAHFTNYWEISKKFIAICTRFSPLVEVFSIDELFLDATYSAHLFGGVYPLISRLKAEIADEIGEYITVSVGISHNRLLAKLASGMKKPDGVFEITPHMVESVYGVAALTDICGIGSRIERRLNQMGIYTLLQLRKAPLASLVAEFGNVEGHFLYDVGQGVGNTAVSSFTRAPETKSVGRNYCLPENQYDKRVVLQNIYELCEEVCLKLRRLSKKARAFGVFTRGTHNCGGHVTYQDYSDYGQDMYEACLQILEMDEENFMAGYTRQIGVWAGLLTDAKNLSLPLLPQDQKRETITHIIDEINEKFGDHTIRNGFLLYADKLTTVPNGFMADQYERMKLSQVTL